MDNLTGKAIKGYELRQLIGRGGFGAVYRAYQGAVQRDVAIKIIHPQYANMPNFIRNFQFEARVIARLEHIHIVPLYDFWRDPDGAYIVMRWLRGGSLSRLIKKEGPLDLQKAANMLDQIASALQIAHDNDVIHQDLKTANILLDEEKNAYLSDFGIAKDLSQVSEKESLDSPEVAHGSPEYMSPEQILNVAVDHRSDIYGLGIVLFEMLTGATPFSSDDDQKILHNQLYDKLPSLQDYKADLPQSLSQVIWKATDKHPRRRYQSTIEMAAALRAAIESESGAGASEQTSAKVPKPIIVRDIFREPTNPYKGLQAFQEADAENFFGREELIKSLLSRLKEGTSASRFLAVVGPSGIGKSSVVKAGLIPALRRGGLAGSESWFITEMTPGNAPIEQLAAAMTQIAAVAGVPILDLLTQGENGLVTVVESILKETTTVVLVVDQFEELFTLALEAERRLFLDLIMNALQSQERRIFVIVTLRADFYDRPLLYPEFGDLLRQRTEVVLPLNKAQLLEVIEKPAKNVGLDLEQGLADAIVGEVSEQPGALPLLQYALRELFANKRGNTLTRDAYVSLGGVSGAMTKRADELFHTLSHDSQRTGRQLFLRLVTLGEGTDDTRRRASRVELMSLGDPERMNHVIEVFGKHRLLSFDHDPETRVPTVEIAHEALIRNWPRLREWLSDNRDALRLQRQLANSVAAWSAASRDRSYLATGGRLAQLQGLVAEDTDVALSEMERAYLHESQQLSVRNQRLARLFVGFLAVLAIILAILAFVALQSQRRAQKARDEVVVAQATTIAERDISRSRELSLTALNLASEQFDLSLLLSLRALNGTDIFTTRTTLLKLLQQQPRIERYLHGNMGEVRAIAFSPDGSLIAGGGADRALRVWDTVTGQLVGAPLAVHDHDVNTVSFSSDGRMLASGGQDGVVFIIELASRQVIGEIALRAGAESVAFNASGSLLAAASDDGTIYVIETDSMQMARDPLTGHRGQVFTVAFSPREDILVSGGSDGRLIFWNLSLNPISPEIIQAGNRPVRSISFNPAGLLLVVGDEDGSLTLWNTRSRQQFAGPFTGHDGTIRATAFDPLSQNFFSASMDGVVFEWDPNDATQPVNAYANLELFPVERLPVLAMSLDPSGRFIATGARKDERITLWDRQQFSQLGRVSLNHETAVTAMGFDKDGDLLTVENSPNERVSTNRLVRWKVSADVFQPVDEVSLTEADLRFVQAIEVSPDGRLIAKGSDHVDIFDAESGDLLNSLLDQRDVILSLAFSQDSRLMASGGQSGSLMLWRQMNDNTWEALGMPIMAHDDRILALAISPAGTEIATGSQDNQVKIWRVDEAADDLQLLAAYEHSDEITSLAYSHNGDYLAFGGLDGTVTLINAERDLRLTANLHGNRITDLVFSTDPAYLFSGGRDGAIIAWEFSDGQLRPLADPLAYYRLAPPIVSVAVDMKHGLLAGGDEEGNILLWDIGIDHWISRACYIANRTFSPDELTEFGIDSEAGSAVCAGL